MRGGHTVVQGFTQSLEVCHCEERSDVAINNERGLCKVDCFAALAMTRLARNGAGRHVMMEGGTQWCRASHKVWRCVIARSEATWQSTMREVSEKWIASLRSQ